jgi:HSP20 family protein
MKSPAAPDKKKIECPIGGRRCFRLHDVPFSYIKLLLGWTDYQEDFRSSQLLQQWEPFEHFRREMDRLFDDFSSDFWRGSLFDIGPFRRAEAAFRTMPAVHVSETDEAYEITAELPGLDEKNIEVKLANGVLSIEGEKQEDKEEKEKDYYRRERSFGSFEHSFQVPEGVEEDKIVASFKNGVLSLT